MRLTLVFGCALLCVGCGQQSSPEIRSAGTEDHGAPPALIPWAYATPMPKPGTWRLPPTEAPSAGMSEPGAVVPVAYFALGPVDGADAPTVTAAQLGPLGDPTKQIALSSTQTRFNQNSLELRLTFNEQPKHVRVAPVEAGFKVDVVPSSSRVVIPLRLANGIHRIKVLATDDPDIATLQEKAEYEIALHSGPLTVVVDEAAMGTNTLKLIFSQPLADVANIGWATAKLVAMEVPEASLDLKGGGENIAPSTSGNLEFTFSGVPFTQHKNVLFRLEIPKTSDIYGNDLIAGTVYTVTLPAILDPIPSVSAGLASDNSGPAVDMPEFLSPRASTSGFNPSDKVETRVVQLYFYRDAHRVAQIINRRTKSYDRAGADMSRQRADMARDRADQSRVERQRLERDAIARAQETRRKEAELQNVEQQLNSAARELTQASLQDRAAKAQQAAASAATSGTSSGAAPGQNDGDTNDAGEATGAPAATAANANGADTPSGTVTALTNIVQHLTDRADALRSQIEELRSQEVAANERAIAQAAREELDAQEQFRREVAAANHDPNTYAPGNPNSQDPVAQVSVSVIGEGVIHLRGPLKGINVIRQMIDQIDSPVGQVHVQVHTVQINGERAPRIEQAVSAAERHIDQARFLTLQCGELLRRAVVQVAAEQADAARGLYPGESQEDRDQRYLHAFFGQDFLRELETLDSEFLRTGNKLLSLHSMDTTSLSSALTLIALANNSTRQRILEQFDMLVASELPIAEERYLASGLTNCGHCKGICRHHHPKIWLLAQNATFESLKAFFKAEMVHDDTLAPLQREFIRLAQILKSRLITELEYKQRVMERSVIEERFVDNYQSMRQAALKAESDAEQELIEQRVVRTRKLGEIRKHSATLRALIESEKRATEVAFEGLGDDADFTRSALSQGLKALENCRRALAQPGANVASADESLLRQLVTQPLRVPFTYEGQEYMLQLRSDGRSIRVFFQEGVPQRHVFAVGAALFEIFTRHLGNFSYTQGAGDYQRLIELVPALHEQMLLYGEEWRREGVPIEVLMRKIEAYQLTGALLKLITSVTDELTTELEWLQVQLESRTSDLNELNSRWVAMQTRIRGSVDQQRGRVLYTKVDQTIEDLNLAVRGLVDAESQLHVLQEVAQLKRRPLDHKKFLDMLVDDVEDKFAELLEGTRAHTANIDNYIKRLTTALDDDFNNQFYYPAFFYVRKASRMWDVQFSQVETTTVLANNRAFAKVAPKATMEFDLPARDILISEGINGGKAIIDDIGALANDPTFLSLARLNGPRSTAFQGADGNLQLGAVRDVLPGLDSSVGEQVLSQNSGRANQFGSNLENLIPDPAIYKFETGTGYEIRPVIQPDGQAVVFDFHYMYTTDVREPVRADEKHLGRVKRHFIDTDVQLSNFELRKVSRYQVALKASRTARGVPLLEDIPVVGLLFRPLPQQESSLQQNLILAQATIFPTLFDLMGLRWAPVVADLDPLRLSNEEFIVRQRRRALEGTVFNNGSSQVDEFLQIPEGNRRPDLYYSQESIPAIHPNGYRGPGYDYQDAPLQEGHRPPNSDAGRFVPGASKEGAVYRPGRDYEIPSGVPLEAPLSPTPSRDDPRPQYEPAVRGAIPPQARFAPQNNVAPAVYSATPPPAMYGGGVMPAGHQAPATAPRSGAPGSYSPPRTGAPGYYSAPADDSYPRSDLTPAGTPIPRPAPPSATYRPQPWQPTAPATRAATAPPAAGYPGGR